MSHPGLSSVHLMILALAISSVVVSQEVRFLRPAPAESEIRNSLASKKSLIVFGRKYAPSRFCTQDAVANPEDLEAYEVRGKKGSIVVFCPAEVDGATNQVTLFSKGGEPRTKSVQPSASSSRLSEAALEKVVRDLIEGKK